MPDGIQVRGPHQYRVQVRRNGVYQSKTFGKLSEAREWQRIMEGKVTGEELVDRKRARSTTLVQACDWMLDGKRVWEQPRRQERLRQAPLLEGEQVRGLVVGFDP
jgi:hypothetical protein